MTESIAGIVIPDTPLVRDTTELVRDTEPDILYNHSRRVFLFGALTGKRKKINYDAELLYVGAMFHDMGLCEQFWSEDKRFEVDGANSAAEFLKARNIAERDIEDVWLSIALHTTPGVPEFLRPTVSLVTAGVEMDVLGLKYSEFSNSDREEICRHHPRGHDFKNGIINCFCKGTIFKPDTTFGNVKADVLALRDPTYKRMNFTDIILNSPWQTE
jgi:hypothetical protein